MLPGMSLYRLEDVPEIVAPTLIVAFDGWVDAGQASTTAAARLVEGAELVATFDADELFDYRARRPTLEILDGKPASLTWPELTVRRAHGGDGRDVLVLAGPEPDYRWRELADAAVELGRRFGVVEWISLGAIPAAVPHTRPVPILGTSSRPGLLRGDVQPGPAGMLRVPSAAISVLDLAVSGAGIAAIQLLRAVGRHIGREPALGSLPEEARELAARLDAAAVVDQSTRAYVERLEAMVDEARLPSGDELISEIERFLREGEQRT